MIYSSRAAAKTCERYGFIDQDRKVGESTPIRYRPNLNHKIRRLEIAGGYLDDDSFSACWEIEDFGIRVDFGRKEGRRQEWSLRLTLTQHGETYQVKTDRDLTD